MSEQLIERAEIVALLLAILDIKQELIRIRVALEEDGDEQEGQE